MKILVTIVLILFPALSVYSESTNETDRGGVSVGMAIKPSLFKNGVVFLTGAKLGLSFNENYYAGLALYGITFQQYKPDVMDIQDSITLYPNIELSYYGFEFEYNPNSDALLSPSFLIFSGFYINSFNIPNTIVKAANYNPDYKESNNSFIIEPSINLNLHLKSYYMITIGICYRYFFALNKTYKTLTRIDKSQFVMDNTELNGISLGIIIRFGSF
jgi:hypothetical protein